MPAHTLWLNQVPEPRTVKQRVHLDVHVAAVSDLLDLGATVLDDTQRWTVLADPEGGELCAFVRDPSDLPDYRLYEFGVDSADPARIATWWADRFGVEVHHDHDQEFSWLEGPPGPPFGMVFSRVPEPKTVKNRLHWDVPGSWTSCSAPEPGCSGPAATTSNGTYSPTRKATSSALFARTGTDRIGDHRLP